MVEDRPELDLASYAHGFPWRNRLGRGLWQVVEATLFRPSPPPLHAWRRALLRLFGAEIHPTAHVYPTARIWAPWNLRLEAHACLSWGVDCYSVDRITLRSQALVSQHARLVTASHDIRDPRFRLVTRPIEIGPGAWVCAYAYVGPGTSLGEGAVVAATATVVRDVEPWTVVGGNPARPIGTRRLAPRGPT
jgi:putative colanic acid biosynthesis acetyltransferase WcaF